MNSLSIIFPYYGQPEMLKYQASVWSRYFNVEIILVDDCSPVGKRAEETIDFGAIPYRPYDIQSFRVLIDVAWNVGGAKNLGAFHAKNEWLLITDLDHVIDPATIESVLKMELDKTAVYTFKRKRRFKVQENNPHQETRLITREMFMESGGFNECFCGHYAFSDVDWVRRLRRFPHEELDLYLERVDSVEIVDAKVSLTRKDARDEAAFGEIKSWLNLNPGASRFMRLPWKRII